MLKFLTNPVFQLTLFSLISLYVFFPSFQMALYGDEWLILWFAQASHYQDIFQSSTIWSAYKIEMAVFDFIATFFGYDGFYYYLFSFICRLASALGVWWFLKRRQILSVVSFLGALIFMVSPIGLETTDWVRNFDSYLGICLLLFCIDRIVIYKTTRDFLLLILGVIFLLLVNPLRSHGNLLVIFLLLAARFFEVRNKIKLILGGIVLIGIYLLFVQINVFGGHLDIQSLFNNIDYYQLVKSYFWNISKAVFPLEISGLNPSIVGLMAVFLLFAISLYDILYRKSLMKPLILLSLLSCYMIFPALRQPDFKASFEHRYLIYSALVIPLLLSFILNAGKENKWIRYGIYGSVLIILFTFIFQSRNYLLAQKTSHEAVYNRLLWQNIQDSMNGFDFQKKRAGVILVADPETAAKIGNSVQFGFGFHMGVLYQIYNESQLPYLIIEDKAGIQSLLKGGDESRKYFGKKQIVTSDSFIILKIKDTDVERIALAQYLSDDTLQNANN